MNQECACMHACLLCSCVCVVLVCVAGMHACMHLHLHELLMATTSGDYWNGIKIVVEGAQGRLAEPATGLMDLPPNASTQLSTAQ